MPSQVTEGLVRVQSSLVVVATTAKLQPVSVTLLVNVVKHVVAIVPLDVWTAQLATALVITCVSCKHELAAEA